MPRDLTALFAPKSIAVIGASRTPQKLGAIIFRNIINSGFAGTLYPVNPNTNSIDNRACYPNVASLPEVPDLAVIATPAELVPAILKQVGEKGIKNAVVIAAGFRETGEEGKRLEEQLISLATEKQINLLGPNCLGFVNNNIALNATFGQPAQISGNLRFISQSGAIAASLFDWFQASGLGFSEFITLGNKAVVNEVDVLRYFYKSNIPSLSETLSQGLSKNDPIGLYLESISDGPGFLAILKDITANNPVIILKPGRSPAAATAMQSHTGALAGADDVLEAVLKEVGVFRAQTLEEFYDLTKALAWENLPGGPNVAVVSNAGGPAVVSADAIAGSGLALAQLDEATHLKLSEVLPRTASLLNPVDLLGDALADRFRAALSLVLAQESVHSCLVILTPQVMTQIEATAQAIGELSSQFQKPIICSFMGGLAIAEGEKTLNRYRLPNFPFPERAIKALAAMWRYQEYRQTPHGQFGSFKPAEDIQKSLIQPVISNALGKKQKALDNYAASKILIGLGLKTPPIQVINSLEEANSLAQQFEFPVVMKLSSPGLLHKREVGGVIAGIMNLSQLESAWHLLERKKEQIVQEQRSAIDVILQKEVTSGVEVLVGVKSDPTFGPMLLFGAGGSLAELIDDKNLHSLPLTRAEIEQLVARSKVFQLLQEEGEPPKALSSLYDLIERFAVSLELIPEIEEIEINPVIVTLNEAWAVDGKVFLKEGLPVAPAGPQYRIAKTLKTEVLASQFHHYVFETVDPLIFKPGQYLSVKVAPEAIRAYSIASHTGENQFELLVDTRPGGPGSRFFANLKPGDSLPFLGPFGRFTLNLEDGASQLLFLATGTGLSAIRCMIESALRDQHTALPIHLYFGLTHVEEIFWRDVLEGLTRDFPNFKYEIALCEPDESWQGHRGYITELVERDFPDASRCAAYLCGAKPMIVSAKQILNKLGCPASRVYEENFS